MIHHQLISIFIDCLIILINWIALLDFFMNFFHQKLRTLTQFAKSLLHTLFYLAEVGINHCLLY